MKKRSDLSPSEITLIEEVGEEVKEALKESPLEVEGAPKTSVKYSDGSFKMKTVMGGWNFLMNYAYLGARGDIIFGLSPEDAQEYDFAEFACKTMDTVFPLAGTELGKKVGIEGENFQTIVDQLIIKRAIEMKDAASREAEAYSDNPNFGLF